MIPLSQPTFQFQVSRRELLRELKLIKHEISSSHLMWAVSYCALLLLHGVLAEDILLTMKQEGYRLGWFFSFISALAAFLISLSLTSPQAFISCFKSTVNSLHVVSGLAFSVSQGLAGVSLLFLRYNTIVVFKSCKVVFVLLTGCLLLRESLTWKSLVSGLLIAFGLVVLSHADAVATDNNHNPSSDESKSESSSSPPSYEVAVGVSLIILSLAIAAVGNIVQQAVLQKNESDLNLSFLKWLSPSSKSSSRDYSVTKSKAEVKEDLILHSSFVTCVALFVVCCLTGEIRQGVSFFITHHSPVWLISKQIGALLILSFGQRVLLSLSQVYGATVVQVLCTMRKLLSFFISVALFPKAMNAGHFIGVMTVTIAAFTLQRHLSQQKKRKRSQSHRRKDLVSVV